MTLEEKKQEIVEEFSMYDEWLDKYEYLIELGKGMEAFPEEKKTEDRLIKGCQSRVWLDSELRDGRLFFSADSDEKISKKFACSLFWGVSYKYTKNIPDFQIFLRDNYFLLSMLSIIPYSRASRDVIQ